MNAMAITPVINSGRTDQCIYSDPRIAYHNDLQIHYNICCNRVGTKTLPCPYPHKWCAPRRDQDYWGEMLP